MHKLDNEARINSLYKVGAVGLLLIACTTSAEVSVQPVRCKVNPLHLFEVPINVGKASIDVPDNVEVGLKAFTEENAYDPKVEVRNGKLHVVQASGISAGREDNEFVLKGNFATFTVTTGSPYSDTGRSQVLTPLSVSARCN